MTNTEIKALSEAYANYRIPNPLTYDDDGLWAEYAWRTREILEWLTEEYDITKKDEI